MTLKFKRNLPIILLLTGILLFMSFVMGNQIITLYTVTPAYVQTWATNLSQIDLATYLMTMTQ